MPEGQVLAGRYELGGVLGRGGMAEVRAGWDLRLGRAVAVKTLLPDLAEQPAIRRRFDGEARAAARLAHPNAVAVFDVGEEGGVPFLVMEQVIGTTLEQEMAGGRLDAGRVRRLGQELLAALGAAHAAGLIHRDVKPSNILIAPDGSAKVADFGIAKAVIDEGVTATQMDLTATGEVLGTVAYMAPERLAGRPATVQSDLYSVGVVLYEALSGARPFAAVTPIAMIHAIDQASPLPLSEHCPGLDAALIDAVERAMAKRPEDRFASAADMSAALQARTGPPAGAADADPTVMVGPATAVFDAPPTSMAPAASASVGAAAPPDPASSPGPAASPVRRARHAPRRLPRHRLLAVLAVAGVALALVTAAVARDNDNATPGETPTATGSPTADTGIPPALDDALRELEKMVR